MCSAEATLVMGEDKDDNSLPVLQRQQQVSRSAVHMDIRPETSSRNLQPWQCALVKWKDPLVWGRRNGACNIVYTGEKTCAEWGRKSVVSAVVQMWESSGRDSFSLQNRWPAEPRTLFRAMLCLHTCSVLLGVPHGEETQSTSRLLSTVCLLPHFSQGQRSREGAKYVTHLQSLRVHLWLVFVREMVHGVNHPHSPSYLLLKWVWWRARKFSILSLGFLFLDICKITWTKS